MARRKRIKRSKSELKEELKDQIKILQHACQSYDSGLEAIGKHIALSLRVLLHHYGQSKSLLEQLKLRQIRYYDTAGPLNPKNLLSECNLIRYSVSSGGATCLPLGAAGDLPRTPKKIRFLDWWNNPVLKDKKGRKFCRRELIQNVANTDGGAHVDPKLDEIYMELSRKNSLGWTFIGENIQKAPEGRPELACMRQIAEELLMTLKEKDPEIFE